MKYFPLVWAAFRRHTTESLLTFVVLTIAFTLFSSMISLRDAYDRAVTNNRMDRLHVSARFGWGGLSIARRDEIARIPGVQGAAAFQWVNPKAWIMAIGAISTYTPMQGYFTNVIVIAAVFAIINLPSVGVWAACGTLLRNVLKDRRWLRLFNWGMAALLVGSLYPLLLESIS